jgi:diadenosine tetraphosphate (Ap4A) HIT family hydrolase
VLGLKNDCKLCDLLSTETNILHEDELCVIIKDFLGRSNADYLCVPKRHIRDVYNLRPRVASDPRLFWNVTDDTKLLTNDSKGSLASDL